MSCFHCSRTEDWYVVHCCPMSMGLVHADGGVLVERRQAALLALDVADESVERGLGEGVDRLAVHCRRCHAVRGHLDTELGERVDDIAAEGAGLAGIGAFGTGITHRLQKAGELGGLVDIFVDIVHVALGDIVSGLAEHGEDRHDAAHDVRLHAGVFFCLCRRDRHSLRVCRGALHA